MDLLLYAMLDHESVGDGMSGRGTWLSVNIMLGGGHAPFGRPWSCAFLSACGPLCLLAP